MNGEVIVAQAASTNKTLSRLDHTRAVGENVNMGLTVVGKVLNLASTSLQVLA